MSSIHLPSIFHHHNKKETTSLLTKRSTISIPSSKHEEDVPTLQRSNITLSKVKRFGSLLVRNKKMDNNNTRRRAADTIFPPNINTSSLTSSSYSLSASSTNTHTSSSDEDDEHLITPTTLTTSPTNLMFDKQEELMISLVSSTVNDDHIKIMSVTPRDQPKDEKDVIYKQELTTTTTSFIDKPELPKLDNIEPVMVEQVEQVKEVDPSTLTMVSLVRYHLNMALEVADKEIENELEFCRNQMLQTLRIKPTFSF